MILQKVVFMGRSVKSENFSMEKLYHLNKEVQKIDLTDKIITYKT